MGVYLASTLREGTEADMAPSVTVSEHPSRPSSSPDLPIGHYDPYMYIDTQACKRILWDQ